MTYTHRSTATGTGTGSVSITKPTGTAEGDLLVAVFSCYDSVSGGFGVYSLAGWTSIFVAQGTPAYDPQMIVLAKVATASEPGSYSFTADRGTTLTAASVSAYSDGPADPNFAVQTASQVDDSAGSLDHPTVTTDFDDALIIRAGHTTTTPDGYVAPSGHTTRSDVDGPSGVKLFVADKIQASAGAVAAATSTFNGSDRIGITVAFEALQDSAFVGWGIPMGIA